jgi:hypothetical protein
VEVLADLLLFDSEDHLGAREENVDVGIVLVGVEHDLIEVVRVSVKRLDFVFADNGRVSSPVCVCDPEEKS